MVPAPQLYDLMTMGFKHQIVSCSSPTQLLQVTLNHMETVRGLVEGECIHVSQGCWALCLIALHSPSPYTAEGAVLAVAVVVVAVVVAPLLPLPFSVLFLQYVTTCISCRHHRDGTGGGRNRKLHNGAAPLACLRTWSFIAAA